jgi:hypothetical protein
MSASNIPHIGASRKTKLPRRDWILLPLLSVTTILVLAFSLRMVGERVFVSDDPLGNCMARDPLTGTRGVPNTVCWKKAAESPPVEYRFNSCGHRAGMECGPKAPDKYRIVMAGSSFAFGWTVKREETFASLLPTELSQRTGHKIELYNASIIGEGGTPRIIALRFNDLLALHPDAILWIVTPWDIQKADPDPLSLVWQGLGATDILKRTLPGKSPHDAMVALMGAIHDKWVVSHPGLLLQHYLFQSQSEYVKLYLNRGLQSGFLKAEPDSDWQYRLDKFNGYAADIEGQAKAAGVPVIAVLVPNRAQVAMISMGKWPAGYDPYKLGEELRAIITSHDGTYIDILPNFRTIPNPEQYYYSIDDHPDARGHAIIADMLARELTSGSVPALRAPNQSRAALEKGR